MPTSGPKPPFWLARMYAPTAVASAPHGRFGVSADNTRAAAVFAQPRAAGTFTKKSTLKLKMPVVKKATTYYASFVAQDANGNISQIYGVNYTVRK